MIKFLSQHYYSKTHLTYQLQSFSEFISFKYFFEYLNYFLLQHVAKNESFSVSTSHSHTLLLSKSLTQIHNLSLLLANAIITVSLCAESPICLSFPMAIG